MSEDLSWKPSVLVMLPSFLCRIASADKLEFSARICIFGLNSSAFMIRFWMAKRIHYNLYHNALQDSMPYLIWMFLFCWVRTRFIWSWRRTVRYRDFVSIGHGASTHGQVWVDSPRAATSVQWCHTIINITVRFCLILSTRKHLSQVENGSRTHSDRWDWLTVTRPWISGLVGRIRCSRIGILLGNRARTIRLCRILYFNKYSGQYKR